MKEWSSTADLLQLRGPYIGHTWRDVPFHVPYYSPVTGKPTRPYLLGAIGGTPVFGSEPDRHWWDGYARAVNEPSGLIIGDG